MARSFLFVSALDPEAARRAVLASPHEVDIAVITLYEAGLRRSADDLERALPQP